MYFNLSPKASTDTFSNLGLIHPLMVGNEFMPPPVQLSDEAQNDYEIICKYARRQGWTQWADFRNHLRKSTNAVVITPSSPVGKSRNSCKVKKPNLMYVHPSVKPLKKENL
jgi:hypothetical protein